MRDGDGAAAIGYRVSRPQNFVHFAGLSCPVLLIVVDTEEGFDWSAPFGAGVHSVSAIERLPLCQSLFERFAICPTYVVDYPIASQKNASRELKSLAEGGRCIIGSQLHPWVNPPVVEVLNRHNSFPGNLPFELELQKLRVLTECIAENLGTTPQIYKAGRYGIGPNTADILRQLGYRVDMSIHSRRAYLEEGGPDFREIPPLPFWLDGDEQVLEIPLTCDYYGLFRRWGDRIYHDWLIGAAGRTLHLPGVSARLGLLNRVSISPEGYPLGEAKRLTRALIERGVKVFTVAFHSPSLEPGNTPYVRSQRDLDALLAWLARYIEFFFEELGGKPTTPLELWRLARRGEGVHIASQHRHAAVPPRRHDEDPSGRSPHPNGASGISDKPLAGTAAAARRSAPASPRIPVLMCVNARYVQHAAVCLVSLLENNRDSSFDVVLVSTDKLTDEATKLFRSVAPYRNCALSIRYFDKLLSVGLPVTAQHYSIDNYTRLWVSEFFSDDVEKILYLDSDMVIVGDIGELWNTDISEWVIGAVSIPGSNRCAPLGIPERYGYFNSGVLLVNLQRWRTERVLDRLLAYIATNSEKIVDVDQDVLNACLYDRRLPLAYVWNVISPFFIDYYSLGISAGELRQIRRSARIIHFNGISKPWSYMCRHPRRQEYWKYLNKTEWRGYCEEDRNALNWIKKHFVSRLPEEMRKRLRDVVRKGQAQPGPEEGPRRRTLGPV
jgi:lipopolysaccharide biosynthesis glycosyltransferase